MRSRDALASDEAFRAALVSAGRRERPDPQVRRAAVAALATATVTTAVMTNASMSASAVVARVFQLAVKAATGTPFTALIVKVVAVSALVMAPVAPSSDDVTQASSARAPAAPTARAALPSDARPSAALPSDALPSDALPSDAMSSDAAIAPLAQPASAPERGALVRRPPAKKRTADTLLEEVERLEATRRAIDAGHLSDAALLLERRGAGDVLGPEAQVLAIELAVRRGRHADARVAAERFLAAHPTSPLAARVQRLTTTSP